VYEALETLAAWHLVEHVDGRWRLVPGTSLHLLAGQLISPWKGAGDGRRPL
jgi:hypothetical protein